MPYARCLVKHLAASQNGIFWRTQPKAVFASHFLVGKDTVKGKNDWQLKCLGLAEVRSGVFVVGT